MRVHIGGDHAAFELQEALVAHLRASGHDVVNHGPLASDAEDDYPVYVLRAAEAVAADPQSRGVVLGGSGNGEQIAANKVDGIRAAQVYDESSAEMSRRHNDANVICLGARTLSEERIAQLVDIFLATPFEGGRHATRVEKIRQLERNA